MRKSERDLYIEIALLYSERSTCLSRHVGAVIVRDGKLIAAGYNGAVSKMNHCINTNTCFRKNSSSGENLDNCVACHAELNAILQCAIHGVSTENAEIYCTDFPCPSCLKAIINAKISKIIYLNEYKNPIREIIGHLITIEKYK